MIGRAEARRPGAPGRASLFTAEPVYSILSPFVTRAAVAAWPAPWRGGPESAKPADPAAHLGGRQ